MADHQKCTCPPRRKESVLTLDGGGIRGYASLLILRYIMTLCLKIEHEYDRRDPSSARPGEDPDMELPLPCHYFDYMFGTSTGGIIAIMLGRLRMNIDDCIDVYKNFGRSIFGRKRKLWWLRYDKYKAEAVESFMRNVVAEHCPDRPRHPSPPLLDPTVRGNEEVNEQTRHLHRYVPCRVAVLAVRKADNDELYMFRSYHNPTPPKLSKNLGKLLNLSHQVKVDICDAARATSAAPTYFGPKHIDGSDFMDGGLEANNPTNWAWMEVDAMHKSNLGPECRGIHGGILHLVSIGTGKGARHDIDIRADRVRRAISLLKKGLHQMTDPEGVHEIMEQMSKIHTENVYTRLNIEEDLAKTRLDEFIMRGEDFITLEKIARAVDKYTRERDSMFETLARQLVDHRRDRCKPDWRRYEGLSRAGKLDLHYLERFRWDDTPPLVQHELHNDSNKSSVSFAPRGHEVSNGHPVVPELSNGHAPNGHGHGLGLHHGGHEMASSPVRVQPRVRFPQEVSASPLSVQTDVNSLPHPSPRDLPPTPPQAEYTLSSSPRENHVSSSPRANGHVHPQYPQHAPHLPILTGAATY